LVPSVGTIFVSHEKKSAMVMNTCSRSQANRQRRSQPKQILQPNPNPEVQNNPLTPPFPPPSGGE